MNTQQARAPAKSWGEIYAEMDARRAANAETKAQLRALNRACDALDKLYIGAGASQARKDAAWARFHAAQVAYFAAIAVACTRYGVWFEPSTPTGEDGRAQWEAWAATPAGQAYLSGPRL